MFWENAEANDRGETFWRTNWENMTWNLVCVCVYVPRYRWTLNIERTSGWAAIRSSDVFFAIPRMLLGIYLKIWCHIARFLYGSSMLSILSTMRDHSTDAQRQLLRLRLHRSSATAAPIYDNKIQAIAQFAISIIIAIITSSTSIATKKLTMRKSIKKTERGTGYREDVI